MFARIRTVAVTIALAAMMLRALMPAGWMPAAQAQGAGFVICTVHGPLKVDGSTQAPAHKNTSNPTCPFFAAPQLGASEQAFVLALPAQIPVPTDPFVVRLAAKSAPHHVLKAPRAPPTSA